MRLLIFYVVLALVLTGPVVPLVLGQEDVTVIYDDGRRTEQIPVWQLERNSDVLYVRANDVARIFKATQFWNASSRKVVLGINRTRFSITVDTRVVVIGGEPLMLRNAVRYEAGFVMVPMEFILDVAPPYTLSVLEWDATARNLLVSKVGYNISGLDFSVTANRSTVTIEMSEPLIHHVDSSTPGLVRLKLYGGRVDLKKFDIKEAHGLFNDIRAEQADRDAFVYFDINRFTERILVEREESPPAIRVILEKGDLPEIPEPDFADRKRVEIVDRRTAQRRRLEIKTVVIDAGHGGKDYGKTGVSGVLEKDVNLILAKKTRDALTRRLGVNVILTREDDRLISLTGRTEIANEVGGDLFISIHCNSWFSDETGGFEAYFLSQARTEWDRAVAKVENSADEFLNIGTGATGDIDFIVWDLVQNEFVNESSYLAELVQNEMTDRLDIRDRGVKQANFTVLQGAHMPAVLIEAAFLSNPSEEQLLVDEDFQKQIADGIVEAVRRFREKYQR